MGFQLVPLVESMPLKGIPQKGRFVCRLFVQSPRGEGPRDNVFREEEVSLLMFQWMGLR